MKGFILGVAFTSAAWGAGLYIYQMKRAPPAQEAPHVAEAEPGAPAKRVRRARRPAPGTARGNDAEGEAPLVQDVPDRKLTAAELRPASRGDDLSRPDVVELDMASKDNTPELSEDQIDQRFHERQEAILDCIDKARPDERTFVPGRINIQFRIQRTGQVRGVRVEAPAILQQGGLYSCVKTVVMGIRFPASTGSQVVTYPFALN